MFELYEDTQFATWDKYMLIVDNPDQVPVQQAILKELQVEEV